MKRAIKIIGLFLVLLGVVTACEKEINTGVVSVRMKDHPGRRSIYEEVNVEIKQVQIYYSSGPQTRPGWINLRTQAGVYNILKLQNGTDVGLVLRHRVPAGRITSLRIMFGERNSIKVDGQNYHLNLDPAQLGGVTTPLNLTIKPKANVQLMIGFSSEQSVAVDGPGVYRLKPVFKVVEVLNNTN